MSDQDILSTLASVDAKPWYASRSIWGGIIALVAAGAGMLGYTLDQAAALEIATQLGGLIGGAMAIYYRVTATHPIRRKSQVTE